MSDFHKIAELEKRLWSAADSLRANTGLTSQQYSRPILGLIFLRYAEFRFENAKAKIETQGSSRRRGGDIKSRIQAEGAMYVPDGALYSNLLKLPEGENIGQAVNDAMKSLEAENESIKDALPKTYTRFENVILKDLLKNFAAIDFGLGSDIFGRIYEYFLNEFAKTEAQGGGEFFTPSSLVRLITEIIEPYHGKVYDPACGSGGMFVSCANFVEEHNKNASDELSIFGQEKTGDTVRLSKMNLAVHGLQGDIREGNSYYEDIHDCVGQFDFVMANPPFNVNEIQKERLVDDKARFPFGMPSVDNGNYIWIQMFYAALNEKGRAGFVMPNSASDARSSEQELRKQLIQSGAVDVMISISPNFFYTLPLPCTLWFFDKAKMQTDRKDKVLFIDAREVFRQVNRTVRDFTSEQLNFISNIVRLYRGEAIDNSFIGKHPDDGNTGDWLTEKHFSNNTYEDIPGLCKVVSIEEIEEQGWSLNPGRYVDIKADANNQVNLKQELRKLASEFTELTEESLKLSDQIKQNVNMVLLQAKDD